MADITTRQEFKEYCLRRLGFPVVNINIDDTQVEDRIDDALLYYTDYHFDALQKFYYIHPVSNTDITNQYLDLSNVTDNSGNTVNIQGITRIFPIQDSQATINMFDLRYQLRLNELYDFTSASYINYTLTMQHLRTLEIFFTGEVPIRYQRHMKRLYIDWAWGASEAPAGMVVVAECYATIDPNIYPDVWNDRWLKQYATALIKKNWGENIKKYQGVQMLGGIALNGQQIWDEADTEIRQLEQEMIDNYSGPLEFMMN